MHTHTFLLLPDLSWQAQLVALIYYSLTSCACSGIWGPTTEGRLWHQTSPRKMTFSRDHMPQNMVLANTSFCYHLMLHPRLGSWLGDSLHAARHSILMLRFSETPEDTSLLKPIEKLVCG